MNKSNLREKMKKIRDGLSFSSEKNCKITDNVIELLDGLKFNSLFVYASIRSEVDTFKLIKRYFGTKKILVPHTYAGKMLAVELDDMDRLRDVSSLGNVFSADNLDIIPCDGVDVTIVPMLAFNKNKYRLGYGGGYYDKFLSTTNTLKIGLAYDEQFVDDDFNEEYDIPLDIIVTQSGKFGG